ncbi:MULTISPECIES: DUF4404 family protein [Pseudomonas]|uniref:DUF4404 family protein n=1 Tax=Pseudomonas TaxID=286 RepID=UPI00257A48F0|nr:MULTISPECIES: DUF4404 family protein [Pseudomonas]
MSANDLQLQLEDLRKQLDQEPPLNDDERASIIEVMNQIEIQLAYENTQPPSPNLVDGVNLAVERFEVSHPTLAGTLRNVMQTLASIGI